jgi:hypothetical protein
LPGWDKKSESERVKQNPDGSFDLNFTDIPLTEAPALAGLPVSGLRLDSTGVSDLRPLAGLALANFAADNCRITDLAPLHGMPLRTLFVPRNPKLRDLTPLHGMPLRQVSLNDTAIDDLRPLHGSPVVELSIGGTRFNNLKGIVGLPLGRLDAQRCTDLTEISAVENMPLREVNFMGSYRIRDFSPLLDCPRLEVAGLPAGIREIDVLRRHPRLWKIGTVGTNPTAYLPADQFWDEFTPAFQPNAESQELIKKARAAGVAVGKTSSEGGVWVDGKGLLSISTGGTNMKDLPDYHGLQVTWIHCSASPFASLSPLGGLPLRGLTMESPKNVSSLTPLAECKDLNFLALINSSLVSDLSPLHGLHLTHLQMEGSLVSDLAPLRGMPLHYLSLRSSKITDLSALTGMTELRDLVIPTTKVADLAPLHKLHLERLIAGSTLINDIAPLAGMPLRVVNIDNTGVRDLSPLLECADLEEATIPRDATNVEVLLHHPKLKRLSYDYDSSYAGPSQTVAEFWKERGVAYTAPAK